jgi:ubiquinone/menaquinone biosynthesis C-methylase UbiE
MVDSSIQKQAFLEGEGDAYFLRNQGRGGGYEKDPILRVMRRLKLSGTAILEIGCGSCDRLAIVNEKFGAECFGIDPSKAAIETARRRHSYLNLEVGTADVLPFPTDRFDLVVFGFCLYLVDPADFFSVAREADRVLKNCGTLLIYDFCTPSAYSNTYVHRDGIVCRKMEWSRMFTWNPAYSLVHREFSSPDRGELQDIDMRITVDVLMKSLSTAFPLLR